MKKLLYGIHDAEGAHILPSGGWCVALVSLSENPTPVNYTNIRSDIQWLVRINWGYGSTGTIPLDRDLQDYYAKLSSFLAGSEGIYAVIIGNEPNHEQERPNDTYISPERYAAVYNNAYRIVKTVNSQIHVLPAAVAPYHASPIPWTEYMRQVWALIEDADGCALHTYARTSDPNSIIDTSRMGPPLDSTFSSFLTYRDAIASVPERYRTLPFYITEFNELLSDGWENDNTGIVEAAYREINWFNAQPYPSKIHCLTLYRWPKYDKWFIEGKQGVIDDFRYAVSLSYASPIESPQKPQEGSDSTKGGVLMPSIKKDSKNAPSPSTQFQREIDERAVQRGVNIVEVREGEAWRAKKIQWFNEQEADRIGPDHHILVDVLDKDGKRVTGVHLKVVWPTGFTTLITEEKPGELAAANYPMSASRNEFSVMVSSSSIPSEMVRGIGMGMDYGSGFNAGIHTSTLVVFQLSDVQEGNVTHEPKKRISILHPVTDQQYRKVTQPFGVNREFYSRFRVDGVSLLGHNGIDFATPTGAAIRAVDDGRVVEVGNDADGYGIYVKVSHEWGESLYAHLSEANVNINQPVLKGEAIGRSGNSGLSSGPHLHFGMRVRPFNRQDGWGGYIDPMKYLSEQQQAPTPSVTYDTIIAAIREASEETGLEFELLLSLAWGESSFRSDIKDGLFQIGEMTWDDWSRQVGARDVRSPLDNARVAAHYLKWLLSQTNGNLYGALVAYNFGIGNVLNKIPPPEITKKHVEKVLHGRDLLRAVR